MAFQAPDHAVSELVSKPIADRVPRGTRAALPSPDGRPRRRAPLPVNDLGRACAATSAPTTSSQQATMSAKTRMPLKSLAGEVLVERTAEAPGYRRDPCRAAVHPLADPTGESAAAVRANGRPARPGRSLRRSAPAARCTTAAGCAPAWDRPRRREHRLARGKLGEQGTRRRLVELREGVVKQQHRTRARG